MPGPKRRFAAAMYIAMMIGAGPLIVIEAEKSGEPRSKPSSKFAWSDKLD